MTREQFDQLCRDVCPYCDDGSPLRQRQDTKEWSHDWPGKHVFCYASNFRNKWQDKIDG